MKTTSFPVVIVLMLTLASVEAQTFTILKSFGVLSNISGFNPECTFVQAPDGTLYGTTINGESSVAGTVFKIQPDGSGFTVLKFFTNSAEGATPAAGVTLSGNALYGTTSYGGISNYGTVFKLNTDGTGYTVLYNFTGSANGDGANPNTGLTLSGGVLYGATSLGGSSGNGTVFKLNTDGTGYTVLESFAGTPDGQGPTGLTLSGSVLYGTTSGGGILNNGTVFKLNTDGTGYAVLKNFGGGSDGAIPEAGVIVSGTVLYGTAGYSDANGVVFKMNTDGTGYTVLKDFLLTGTDGAFPVSPLTLAGNVLYGTTASGGTVSPSSGTVFKLNTDGTGYTILKRFANSPDGATPQGEGLTLSGSVLYGTTYWGGVGNWGAVFKLNTDGTGYRVLKSFTYMPGGATPTGGPTASADTLYGTAELDGLVGEGTVFKLNTDGTGYTVLHTFGTMFGSNPTDGGLPQTPLTLSGTALYGTTYLSVGSDSGTVFKLNTDGTGYALLKNFTGWPDAAGIIAGAGLTLSGSALYGTTYSGGNSNVGTVFRLNTDGTGYSVLHSFGSSLTDGETPEAGLILAGSVLYGTTYYGGSLSNGTVFKLNLDGTGYAVLYNFTGASDGTLPGGLALSGQTLYGTTLSGGFSNLGTVYSINTDGSGYTVLKSFTGGSDGASPSSLTPVGSTLYGTSGGGSSNLGTVFKLNKDGTGYVVLYNFTGSSDGANPQPGLTLSGSTLYGTTASGGELGEGVVFSLNLAPRLNITPIPGRVVLSWADPTFGLQAAPAPTGVYTNIPGATTPYTNSLAGSQKFFRLSTP